MNGVNKQRAKKGRACLADPSSKDVRGARVDQQSSSKAATKTVEQNYAGRIDEQTSTSLGTESDGEKALWEKRTVMFSSLRSTSPAPNLPNKGKIL
jgi:hypothetical protein